MPLYHTIIQRTYFKSSSWLSSFEWDGKTLIIDTDDKRYEYRPQRMAAGRADPTAEHLLKLLVAANDGGSTSGGAVYNRFIKGGTWWQRVNVPISRDDATMSFAAAAWKVNEDFEIPISPTFKINNPAPVARSTFDALLRRVNEIDARSMNNEAKVRCNTGAIQTLTDSLYSVTRYLSALSGNMRGTPTDWRDTLNATKQTMRDLRVKISNWKGTK